ncbi:MAG: hypothetical protein ACUVWK_01180 [Nitrososphaerales archaeon]
MTEEKTEEEIRCPWCGSKFPDNKTLSKHIDDVHVGRGLLEGDKRKWVE